MSVFKKIHILSIIKNIFERSVHTYTFPGPTLNKVQKDITSICKDLGHNIAVNTNMKTVDFLNVTLDLVNEKYASYRKPNDHPLYVHTDSNHPPTVLKRIPKSINKRLSSVYSSEFSDSETEFDNENKIVPRCIDRQRLQLISTEIHYAGNLWYKTQ